MSSDTNRKDDSTNAGGACRETLPSWAFGSHTLNRTGLCSHQGSLGIVLTSEFLFLIPRRQHLVSAVSSSPDCVCDLRHHGWLQGTWLKSLVWDASAGTRGQQHPSPLRRCIRGFQRNTTRCSAFSLKATAALACCCCLSHPGQHWDAFCTCSPEEAETEEGRARQGGLPSSLATQLV